MSWKTLGVRFAGCYRRRDSLRRERQHLHRLGFPIRLLLERRQQPDEGLHDGGIQRVARFLFDHPGRFVPRHRIVERPARGEAVEQVHRRQDTGAERDGLPGHPVRVALAVPALVVSEDERSDRVGEPHVGHNLGADLRVDPDPLELLVGQGAGLRQDVFGNRELADVVEQRRRPHTLHLGAATFPARARCRPRTPGPVGCGTSRSGPSRRWPAPAPRPSPGAGPTSRARGAARRPPARSTGRRCGGSGREARRAGPPATRSGRAAPTRRPTPRRRR